MELSKVVPMLQFANIRVETPHVLNRNQYTFLFHLFHYLLPSDETPSSEELNEFDKYCTSFELKRIIQCWKQKRRMITSNKFAHEKINIYKEIFNDIKPFLIASYKEEFEREDNTIEDFTFYAFLWNQEYITDRFQRYKENKYWNEIIEVYDELKMNQLI